MAASGNQPVSADNLAALAEAMGVSVAASSGALTGDEPICVDNLKAFYDAVKGGGNMVAYVIFDNGSGYSASVQLDPTTFDLMIVYLEFNGIGSRYHDPLVVMNPAIGSNRADGATVSIASSGSAWNITTSLSTDWLLTKIVCYR